MTQTLDVGERLAQLDSSDAMGGPTSATHTRTFAITFGIAFTLLYTVFERLNWPLFTYQPAVGKLYFWLHRPLSGEGPPMYWYGWIVLAAASALGWPGSLRLFPASGSAVRPFSVVFWPRSGLRPLRR
jgi:hypothetical protein